MKSCLSIIMLMFILLTGIPLTAQDDDLPDPADIFAEGVEILDVRVFPMPSNNPQPQIAYPTLDNDTRMIEINTVFYAYPDEIAQIRLIRADDEFEGRYLLEVNEYVDDTNEVQQWLWYFYPQENIFVRYESLCDQQPPLNYNTYYETWVIINDSSTDEYVLCETHTGIRSSSLPTNYQWSTENTTLQPELSPNGNWVLLFARDLDPSFPFKMYLFSYEVTTRQFRLLGDFRYREWIFVMQWLDDEVLINVSETWEWANRIIYIATLNEESSLEWAVTRLRSWPDYYEDPSRLEYVSGMEGDGSSGCTWVIYDIETRLTISYDLGMMCLPEIGELNETAYYRDVPDSRNGAATLVRFNAITGEREDLYTGEIEGVINVSDDGRYATLLLDNDGVIDTPIYIQSDMQGIPTEPHIARVDLVTDEILFEFPAGWGSDGYLNAFPLGSLWTIDEDTFLAISNTSIGYSPSFPLSSASIYTNMGDSYEETFLVDNVVFAINRQRLLIAPQGSLYGGIELFDVEARTSQPLIHSINSEVYEVDIERYYGNGELRLTLYDADQDSSFSGIIYTIRVP